MYLHRRALPFRPCTTTASVQTLQNWSTIHGCTQGLTRLRPPCPFSSSSSPSILSLSSPPTRHVFPCRLPRGTSRPSYPVGPPFSATLIPFLSRACSYGLSVHFWSSFGSRFSPLPTLSCMLRACRDAFVVAVWRRRVKRARGDQPLHFICLWPFSLSSPCLLFLCCFPRFPSAFFSPPIFICRLFTRLCLFPCLPACHNTLE